MSTIDLEKVAVHKAAMTTPSIQYNGKIRISLLGSKELITVKLIFC